MIVHVRDLSVLRKDEAEEQEEEDNEEEEEAEEPFRSCVT